MSGNEWRARGQERLLYSVSDCSSFEFRPLAIDLKQEHPVRSHHTLESAMRTTVAASLSALLITAGSLASAEAAPPVVRGEYTPYSYALTSKIACKTRTNNDGVEQISWIPEYHMTGDENHAAKKIYVKVRVDPNDSKKKGTWTTGKKTSVTPGEPFSKWKRVATPWVGVKRERDLMTHIVFHRTTSAGDFVGRGSLTELPTADSGECEAE